MRVPWTARRSNQSVLKDISPECALEGLMQKLKLQYFDDMRWRTGSLENTAMLGKIEGRKRRGRQRKKWLASPTQWKWVWASSGNRWCSGKPGVLQSMGMQRVDLTTERLNRTDESSKYSCHSYIFWMSWSLPLLQGWFPYGGKEVWENVFSPWFIKCDPGIHFPGQIIRALTKTLQASWNYHCPYEPQTREDWQKQYKNWTLAV